ncbi:MAG: hypothetical protein KC543_11400 [Myxococcales bacterium]|nr:hypothetical protein [Myxococcales bacterium]
MSRLSDEVPPGRLVSSAASEARLDRAAPLPPRAPSREELDAWRAQVRRGLRYVARGAYRAALRVFDAAAELPARAGVAMNRDRGLATEVLDACLWSARAYVERGDRARGLAQVRGCRVRVPRGAPTAGFHTPEVLSLLAEVDESSDGASRGSLRVTAARVGCVVRVNGVALGTTPAPVADLLPATYAVQVECAPGQPGRVLLAEVTGGASTLSVGGSAGRAVAVDGGLSLRYASAPAGAALRAEDAAFVARAVGAQSALLVEATDQGTRVERVDGDRPEVLASAWLGSPDSWDAATVTRAFSALSRGESIDLRCDAGGAGCDGAGAAARGHHAASRWDGPSHPKAWAGASTLGAGLAGTAASWVLYARRRRAGRVFRHDLTGSEPGFLDHQAAWLAPRPAMLSLAGAAAPVSALGASLLDGALRDASRPSRATRWTVAAAGVVGAGLAAWGVGELVAGGRCHGPVTGRCVGPAERFDRGALLLSSAAPLLYFPIAAWIRQAVGSSHGVELGLDVTHDQAAVWLRGAL